MPYRPDVDAMAPILELGIDYAGPSVSCVGDLDVRTKHHLVEAVGELVATTGERAEIAIDVSRLHLADLQAANTLAEVQGMVRAAGMRVRWRGLGSDRLRGILPMCLTRRDAVKPSARPVPDTAKLRHPSSLPPPA